MPAGSLEYGPRALTVSLQTVLNAPLPNREADCETRIPKPDNRHPCWEASPEFRLSIFEFRNPLRGVRSFGKWLEPR
jgi:hypothetical protein